MIDSTLVMYLNTLVKSKGSDLHLNRSNTRFRVNGILHSPTQQLDIPEEKYLDLLRSMVDRKSWEKLEENKELDTSIDVPNVGRFRVNIFQAQGEFEVVFRHIKDKILSLQELGMPPAISKFANYDSGLVLVAGPTGSGKTTTLAAVLDKINTTQAKRIISIEDPVEVIHHSKRSLVSQRELGIDTLSLPNAIRAAMREDPDVILVGEIRDRATAMVSLEAAQTGHLVFGTIHASSTRKTVNRFVELFPREDRENTLFNFMENLQAIVYQRLIRSDVEDNEKFGKNLLINEIMVNNRLIHDIIMGESEKDYDEALAEDTVYGMKTFEEDLVNAVIQKKLTSDTARKYAPSEANFLLALKRAS